MYAPARCAGMNSRDCKQERMERGRAQMIEFRDKLFSLANSNEHVRLLWYSYGQELRQAHPTADMRQLLSLIVKAIWNATKKDAKLHNQVFNLFKTSSRMFLVT